jgi:CheY-like chemotaxis protein
MTHNIVIYTDNAPAAALFQRVLGSRFDYIQVVRDREAAYIEALGRVPAPDLIVLDATVPDAGGFYEYVRSKAPYLPFLVVGSGEGESHDPLMRYMPSALDLKLLVSLAEELVEAGGNGVSAG